MQKQPQTFSIKLNPKNPNKNTTPTNMNRTKKVKNAAYRSVTELPLRRLFRHVGMGRRKWGPPTEKEGVGVVTVAIVGLRVVVLVRDPLLLPLSYWAAEHRRRPVPRRGPAESGTHTFHFSG